MKHRGLMLLAAAALVAGVSGLIVHTQATPAPRPPKIDKTVVFRRVKDIHSTDWAYYVRITGQYFNRKSKVEINGEQRGQVRYVMASRDVMALIVELGSWSRVYQTPRKYGVNVVNPDGGRSNVVEVSW
jgi:hypothetical protein